MINYQTTSMTLSVGNYKRERKSGFNQWGRVICHVSPVNARGKVVTSISATVEFWPADQAVPGLYAEAKAKAENISSESKSYERFVFKGDNIPEDYQDMFSFMGELTWEFIKFDEPMVKVHRSDDGRKIELIKDENNRPIIKEGETLAYWVGPMIGSGLQLSRDYRLARMMRDWMPLSSTPAESTEDDSEQNDPDALQGES